MNYNIAQCVEKHQVVSVYCDYNNPDSHLTGYLQAFDEDYILIDHISPNGYYDGYVLIRRLDVFRVDILGKYEEKIETLYKYRNQTHSSIPREQTLLLDLIYWALLESHVVSVEVDQTIITGLVDGYKENALCINVFDSYAEPNGKSVITLDTIQSLSVDSTDEACINLLMRGQGDGSKPLKK